MRYVRDDGLAEVRLSFQKLGILDDREHLLLVRYLLPEERLHPDDAEFEIIDGNDRIVLLREMGIPTYHNYDVILQKVGEEEITWEVRTNYMKMNF